MACTDRRIPQWKGAPGPKTSKKMGIGSVYPGCLASTNAAGYLVNGTNAASTKCAGIADGGGTASSNGQFEVEVFPEGVIKLKNSSTQPVTQAYVGKTCYIEDNETVAITTSQKIRAGLVEAVDTDGVWVNVRAEAYREAGDLQDGGDDEMSLAGMAGELATAQPPKAHKTSHENGGTDEISVAGLSGTLADAQTPAAHKTSHENGGADEISVAGLSGTLADAQTPAAHKTSHENGGADEISLAGLSGKAADAQDPVAHAASHAAGAADVIGLGGLPYTIRQIALSNLAAPFSCAGSAAWQTVHTFNIANAATEALLAIATLDVHSLAGIAGMASFRLTVGGVGGASGVQIDVDMLGVGIADRKCVTVMVSLTGLAADAARAITLEILDTAGLTYTVDHASVIAVRQQG
jgi:hypothetical protein